MSLPPDLGALLAAGHGVLVPDSTRAASIAIAHGANQIDAGQSVWSTPDIATTANWLTQVSAEARRPLMSSATEWMLLRQRAQQDGVRVGGAAAANSLADSWQRSLHKMRDLDISLGRVRSYATPESRALAAAYDHLEKYSLEWGVRAPALCSPRSLPVPKLRTAFGFATPPRAFAPWLQAAASTSSNKLAGVKFALHTAATPTEELMAAMSWAAHELVNDADKRLVVMVPANAAYGSALDTALRSMVLLGDGRKNSILLDERCVLGDAPVVRQQLFLLALLAGGMPVIECCMGLRSGGATIAEQAARAYLASELASQITGRVDLNLLMQVAARKRLASQPHIEQWLMRLLPARDALAATHESRIDWPERIAAASQCLPVTWRDDSIDRGYGTQKAWQELLIESVALNSLRGSTRLSSVLRLLTARASRTVMALPRGDSRLHVTRGFHDPVLRYDGIWVCGLAAAQWPLPPQPDPWLPKALQIEAGDPAASAAGRLQEAHSQLMAWSHACSDLHLSYPGLLDDHPASLSPLLHRLGMQATPAIDAASQRQSRAAQIAAATPHMQAYQDDRYSRRITGAVVNGVESLNRFNECAFQGSAIQRLLVSRQDQAMPGLDARDSGGLLHLALERVWQQLSSQADLKRIPISDTGKFVAGIIDELIATRIESLPSALSARRASLHVEAKRLSARLVALLDAEREREPFVIHGLELRSRLELAGVHIDVRLDRVDRIGNDLLVIDYKSGASGYPRWDQAPPREIQLLLYREALRQQGHDPAGLLTWHLLPDRVRAGGALADDLKLPATLQPRRTLVDFKLAKSQWTPWLTDLAREFWQGDARLQPRKNACQRCDLTLLCRRLERLGLMADAESGEDLPDTDGGALGAAG